MRHSLFCTVVLAAALNSTYTLPGFAQSTQAVTVAMHPCGSSSTVIPVTLNGTGPYDFLLDTGTNTTVIDTALFNLLGLHPEGSVELQSPTNVNVEVRSSVEDVGVGEVSGKDLEVVILPKLPFGPDCRRMRGILGENFLKYFDLLIDNQHRQVTLDAGTGLADSLQGERLPVATAPVAGAIEYRPIVTITLQDFDRHPVKVLLDSGTQVMVMFQQRVQTLGSGGAIRTVNGALPCSQSRDWLGWGKAISTVVLTLTCERSAETLQDHIGNLPTSLFHQIFISHPGSYVIVNPVKRSRVQQEVAVVTP